MKVVITGGGTGGHLFPGIAVADEIVRRYPGAEVLFVGSGRKLDATALSQRNFRSAAIHCQGLKGFSWGRKLATLCQLPLGVIEAYLLLRRFRPELVLGVGGYVTGPVIVAAKLLGIRCYIHEQNSVPGLANRWLARIVDHVFLSIPGSEGYFPTGKTTLSGNPVRRELLALAAQPRAEAGGGAGRELVLLVLGGSQGAHRLNSLVAAAVVGHGADLPVALRVIHQTGASDEEQVRSWYRQAGVKAEVAAFFHDMQAVYAQADLVVSRAGATTLAELAILAKAAILVPYPYAADDHQTKNAHFLVAAQAARMLVEADLTAQILAEAMAELLHDHERRWAMGRAAGGQAKPQAVEAIVDKCLPR